MINLCATTVNHDIFIIFIQTLTLEFNTVMEITGTERKSLLLLGSSLDLSILFNSKSINVQSQSPLSFLNQITLLLFLRFPKSLNCSFDTPLIIQGDLAQPQKRDEPQRCIEHSRRPQQSLTNFGYIIGGHIIHPDPTMR